MDKPKFKKGDLVRWKHGTDVGVVVELGHDRIHGLNKELYALVHWSTGIETQVYEKHGTWHGVEVFARAEEK